MGFGIFWLDIWPPSWRNGSIVVWAEVSCKCLKPKRASNNLNSFEGIIQGSIIRVIKRDSRSLAYSSCRLMSDFA